MEDAMYNPDVLFKIAEMRRRELMKEAENYRLARQIKKGGSPVESFPFVWAWAGLSLTAVILSLLG
jgi:hypothetical protein